MSAPTHQDAHLLLKLYDLRREDKLRESRDFLLLECPMFNSFEEYVAAFPDGSPHAGHVGRAMGYWEMVCNFVDMGILNEDLFNACTGEHVALYAKFKPVIEGFRRAMGNPELMAVLERVAQRHPRAALIERDVKARAERMAKVKAAAKRPAAKAKKPKARAKSASR